MAQIAESPTRSLREIMDLRNELHDKIRSLSLYPWRYDHPIGLVDEPLTEQSKVHHSNGTIRNFLETQTTFRAESVDRNFRFYNSTNCFYILHVDTGVVHSYYGYPAFAAWDRHVSREPADEL